MGGETREMNLESLFLRIRPGEFHFLKSVLEGYDGLALLSNYDIRKGLVVLRFPGEMRREVFGLLGSLAHRLTPFPDPPLD